MQHKSVQTFVICKSTFKDCQCQVGIDMSVMRRQTEISIVPSSQTHKETPVFAADRGRDFDCFEST